MRRVAESLKRFGFGAPIVARRDGGEIIAGHTRWKAARELGMAKIPVRFVDLSADEAHALALADNRVGEVAAWDDDVLAAVMADMRARDVALDGLGFDSGEVGRILADAGATAGLGDPDAVPERPPSRVQPGDVWALGAHRVLCGDSTDAAAVERACGGLVPTCTVLDPPYEALPDVWTRWITDPSIVFGQARHIRMIPDALWRFERVVVKRHTHRSATVQVQHSHAFVAQVGSEKLLPRDKKATLSSVIQQESDTDHDHQKPAPMIAEHLTHWTPVGNGVVVDPYAGSGSTVIACEMTGRRCVAIELSPSYCDVILARWEQFTGRRAEKVTP